MGVLGNTESGKEVLSSDAEGYSKDFNADDHREAAKIHKDHQAKTQIKQRSFMNGKAKGFNHRLLSVFSDKEAKHSKHAKFHEEQAEVVVEEAKKQQAAKIAAEAQAQEVKKSFLQKLETLDLEKGGKGSGKKGHRTERIPYPGEEAHKLKQEEVKDRPKKTLQAHELPPDHYTMPGLTKYKKLLKLMGEDIQGHFTYDPKSDKILAISSQAKDKILKLMGKDKLDAETTKEVKKEVTKMKGASKEPEAKKKDDKPSKRKGFQRLLTRV